MRSSTRLKVLQCLIGMAFLVCGFTLGKLFAEASGAGRTSLFLIIVVGAVALAFALGYVFSNNILRPMQKLKTPITFPTADGQQTGVRGADRVQIEKLSSLARLAGGVAHEINNPLTGIFTFTHMLLRRTDLPAEIRSDLSTISQETERVRKIVKGLLDFSRQTEPDRRPVHINLLCRSAVARAEHQARTKNVRLDLSEGEGLPDLVLDYSQMQVALLNIVLNALDATEAGGRVTLATAIAPPEQNSGAKGVEVICRDTGCGISPDHLDKIFDPFFTIKEVGQGAGLGLSIAHGIIEQHGGTISVQSEAGRGSTFTIWLPLEELCANDICPVNS